MASGSQATTATASTPPRGWPANRLPARYAIHSVAQPNRNGTTRSAASDEFTSDTPFTNDAQATGVITIDSQNWRNPSTRVHSATQASSLAKPCVPRSPTRIAMPATASTSAAPIHAARAAGTPRSGQEATDHAHQLDRLLE